MIGTPQLACRLAVQGVNATITEQSLGDGDATCDLYFGNATATSCLEDEHLPMTTSFCAQV